MALLDEVISETTNRVVRKAADSLSKISVPGAAPADEEKEPRRRRRRNPDDMTKEEREAWLQKKQEEEEARYLKDRAKENKGAKVAQPEAKVKRVCKAKAEPEPQPAPKPAPKHASKPVPKPVQRRRKIESQRPRIAQPLEPLYLLRIPGLPKGDCIAICYARGADVSCS